MELTEIDADLFIVDPKYALVQCISKDVEMGDGIAVDFDFLFSGMKEHVIDSDPQVGKSVLYKHHDGRIVFNLITKKRSFHKPTYETIESSLIDMRNHIITNEITFLAMPKIGTGLDKLVWVRVKQIIQAVLEDVPVNVLICNHVPRKRSIIDKMLARSTYAR
jgi:hypothetical protein